MTCLLANRSKLNQFGSLNRLKCRGLIERYCEYAYMLPVHERMMFLLYFRDGYSTTEISQLLMKRPGTIARRLHNIAEKLNKLCQANDEGAGREISSLPVLTRCAKS